jgi:hypothetical protein
VGVKVTHTNNMSMLSQTTALEPDTVWGTHWWHNTLNRSFGVITRPNSSR